MGTLNSSIAQVRRSVGEKMVSLCPSPRQKVTHWYLLAERGAQEPQGPKQGGLPQSRSPENGDQEEVRLRSQTLSSKGDDSKNRGNLTLTAFPRLPGNLVLSFGPLQRGQGQNIAISAWHLCPTS